MTLPVNPHLIEYLNSLFCINQGFVESRDKSFFQSFEHNQTPQTTLLKCSDSRVHMDPFCDDPYNAVFAIRNIGNQLSTNEASVDFGVKILKTPFLLIMGHSGCGAVDAALKGESTAIVSIDREVKKLKLCETDCKKAVIENLSNQIVKATEKYCDLVATSQLTILGALYDFKNDYGYGYGSFILHSVNGIHDTEAIHAIYAPKVEGLKLSP